MSTKKKSSTKATKTEKKDHLEFIEGLHLYDLAMARLDELLHLPDNVYFGNPITPQDEQMRKLYVWLVMSWRHDVRELFKSYLRGDKQMAADHGLTCDQQDAHYLVRYKA